MQSHQKKLDLALVNLAREDPSLRVSVGGESSIGDKMPTEESGGYNIAEDGQIIISGMGELHLEIILDRIRREYNVDADLGPL